VRERLLLVSVSSRGIGFLCYSCKPQWFQVNPLLDMRTDKDLALVDPIGTHLIKAILWDCQCGNTRAVLINRYTPSGLSRRR